jgi:hypothetical protein
MDNTAGDFNSYNLPYEAVSDTEWNHNPMFPDAPTGSVSKGTKVFFDREEPITPTWQLAKFEDDSLKYVHPADFKKL